MSVESSEPYGAIPVCPRCGTAAREGIWCEGCGLNLTKQAELPTADAYAADVREQRWLAAQAEQAEAARAEEAHGLKQRRAMEEEEHARVEREQAKERAGASANTEVEQPPRRTRRRWLVALTSVLALLLVAGGVAFALLQGRGDSDASSQEASQVETPPKSQPREPPATPPRCSRNAARRELERRDLLGDGFDGVSRVVCRDFTGDGAKDAAFTRQSIGSAGTLGWGVLTAKDDGSWELPLFREDDASVGIKADGSDLLRSEPIGTEDDANCCPSGGAEIEVYRYAGGRFRKATEYQEPGEAYPSDFYPESQTAEEPSEVVQCGDSDPAPITNVTAENIECEAAFEVAADQTQAEQEGWTCEDTDTGYESSSTVCTKDEARVTYDFAV